jgi:hypothetical protein
LFDHIKILFKQIKKFRTLKIFVQTNKVFVWTNKVFVWTNKVFVQTNKVFVRTHKDFVWKQCLFEHSQWLGSSRYSSALLYRI